MNFSFNLDTNSFKNQIMGLKVRTHNDFKKALKKSGIIFLTKMNTTDPKPPIKTGVLRGSSHVFLGNKRLKKYSDIAGIGKGSDTAQTPPVPVKDLELLFGYNTPYAHRQHENIVKNFTPGAFSQQDGGVGNKWLERHMKQDGSQIYKLAAEFIRRGKV